MIARLDAAVAQYGQSVTLQHTAVDPATGGITVADEVTCAAAVRAFGPTAVCCNVTLDRKSVV